MGIHLMPPLYEIVIKPAEATTTVTGDTADSTIWYYGYDYNTAWTAAVGTNKNPASTVVSVGQLKVWEAVGSKWGYTIYRGAFLFDTTPLVGLNLIRAYLQFKANSKQGNPGDLIIQSGMPTYPHDPVELADYNKDYYSGNYGSIPYADVSTVDWNSIKLTANGLALINKAGMTKFMLRTEQEIAGNEPSGSGDIRDQYVIWSADDATRKPRLYVVYAA